MQPFFGGWAGGGVRISSNFVNNNNNTIQPCVSHISLVLIIIFTVRPCQSTEAVASWHYCIYNTACSKGFNVLDYIDNYICSIISLLVVLL